MMFGFMRIAFMNFVIFNRDHVTNEHWYVWFVLIAGHLICVCSWLVTTCDIWPVVGVSSIMNATCGSGPYLPPWAFVFNFSFNGVAVAQTSFLMWTFVCLLFFVFLYFGMLDLVTQILSFEFPYTYSVLSCHCI